jgi:hypothetical protein
MKHESVAARICLQAPLHLLAADNEGGTFRTAEESVLAGHRARFEIVYALLVAGAPEKELQRLVLAEGEHGSDRLLALWWESLTVYVCRASAAAPFDVLNRPVEVLVKERMLSRSALAIITDDPRRLDRVQARLDLASFQDGLMAMAKE